MRHADLLRLRLANRGSRNRCGTPPKPFRPSSKAPRRSSRRWVGFAFMLIMTCRALARFLSQRASSSRDFHHAPIAPCSLSAAIALSEAIELLNGSACTSDPYSPWLNARLAWAYHLAGEARKALQQAEHALDIFPDHESTNIYGCHHPRLQWQVRIAPSPSLRIWSGGHPILIPRMAFMATRLPRPAAPTKLAPSWNGCNG